MLAIASGATMGMMLSFANIYPVGIVSTLAIGGLTSAMAGRFRKIFMPIGFVLSFAPMVVYYRLDLLLLELLWQYCWLVLLICTFRRDYI